MRLERVAPSAKGVMNPTVKSAFLRVLLAGLAALPRAIAVGAAGMDRRHSGND